MLQLKCDIDVNRRTEHSCIHKEERKKKKARRAMVFSTMLPFVILCEVY